MTKLLSKQNALEESPVEDEAAVDMALKTKL